MDEKVLYLLKVMRDEAIRRFEEERKKRKEVFRIRTGIPYRRSGSGGALERERRVV